MGDFVSSLTAIREAIMHMESNVMPVRSKFSFFSSLLSTASGRRFQPIASASAVIGN